MVGIIILNYNNAGLTLDCIESILKFNTYPAKIVIVDNASTDDSVSMLEKELPKFGSYKRFERTPDGQCSLPDFSFVVSESNSGYAQGNNLGLKLLEADPAITHDMVLNNDILFVQDIIPGLVDFADSHDDAALVSPLLLARDGVSVDSNCARKDCGLGQIFLLYLSYTTDYLGILRQLRERQKIFVRHPELLKEESVPVELPSGSCMLIGKERFRELGYFDPATFLYYEENILFRKALSKGWENYVLPGLKCIHLACVTREKIKCSAEFLYKCNESAIYYALNYRRMSAFKKKMILFAYNLYISIFNSKHSSHYAKRKLS